MSLESAPRSEWLGCTPLDRPPCIHALISPHIKHGKRLESQPAGPLLLKLLGIDEGLVYGLDHQLAAVHALGCHDVVDVRLDALAAGGPAAAALAQADRVALLLGGRAVAGLGGLGGGPQLLLELLQAVLLEGRQVRRHLLGRRDGE